MKIEFDPKKAVSNQEKHGLCFSLAYDLEWEEALIWEDTRHDYSEIRLCGLVPFENRVYYIVFTERQNIKRIISLRKANPREVRRYVAEN